MEKLHLENRKTEFPANYLKAPIAVMENEHEHVGDIMFKIRELTNNYTAPEDACTTFKVSLTELKEFEDDLHEHVHLENNVLFPKAQQFANKSSRMPRRFLIAFGVTLICYFPSQACPICGCGGGNLYMGLMPNFKYHFIGVRYHNTQYYSQLISDPNQYSSNYYNSIELWGGMHIGKKIQLMAFIPYYINKQVDDDGETRTHGLGDITVNRSI